MGASPDQESGSSWSDLALINLHSISPPSRPISATSRTIRTARVAKTDIRAACHRGHRVIADVTLTLFGG
eukprot:868976-Prymnesium_polylepis.1